MNIYKDLDKHIEEMHNASNMLSEYSFPKVCKEDEKQIMCLREREIFVCGYDITVVLSYNNYPHYKMQTLQMYASYGAFLPFSLVCKLAEKFLGNKSLYYVSVMQNDRKIYIWTVCKNNEGDVVDDKSYLEVKKDTYNNLNFNRVLSIDNSKFF